MSLWTSQEIAQAVGGTASEDFTVNSLSIDTRSLEAKALFIPLKDVRDGHDFIPQAIEAGASGTLSEIALEGVPHVHVADSFGALQKLAKASAARSSALRIAVTGSVGKTSVKDALAIMLASFGPTHRSIKSFNNHWGVPLTLAGMPKESKFGVFEMGMNNAGEISVLSKSVVPHIALITIVAPAHLAHFNNVEEIADAKGEIIEGLQDDGILILNGDNQYTPRIRKKAGQKRVITFGRNDKDDVQIIDATLTAIETTAYLKVEDRQVAVTVPIAGAHWVSNIAACIAVAYAADLDLDKAGAALKAIQPSTGRGDVTQLNVEGKSVLLVDESYNANPTSMEAAFHIDPDAKSLF
jgi:UDP-N-acetylmuramoyl-tripeptide--D-alanyl-D-alanine ligase